jgi:uncharacterized protein
MPKAKGATVGKLLMQINDDIKSAMRAKDEVKLMVLRMAKTAINNAAIAKSKNEIDDAEELEVMQKQAKQRRESIEGFEKGGRAELAAKEKAELSVLEAYLPKQLSDDELRAICKEVIAKTASHGEAEMGKVMKELMPLVKGKADGRRVQDTLKSLLS